MFLSLTKSMILWHNTKLKTIGAIMSTGCCRFCSAAVLSVLSVQCLYLPHSSVFTHLQIHPLLADCAPQFRLWAECSHENKQLPVCTLCSPALCHSYFGQISQNPSRLKMLHTAMRHIPAIASQIELSCLTPLKI